MSEIDIDDALAKVRAAVETMPLEMIREMYNAQQAMVPPELRAQGWVYRDVPRMSLDYWAKFVEVMGVGNYQLLIMSQGPDWARGQFFMSPKAMENLQAWVKELKP